MNKKQCAIIDGIKSVTRVLAQIADDVQYDEVAANDTEALVVFVKSLMEEFYEKVLDKKGIEK